MTGSTAPVGTLAAGAGTRAMLALVPGVAAVVAAWPLRSGDFYGDDFQHLFEMSTVGPGEFIVAPFGGHMYLVRNLVFYLSFLAFGMNPRGYFIVAIATHVAVSLGVGALARRLSGDALIGCLAGVLFAVAPANHGTLGWLSAFGHALAAAAVLAGLLVVAPRPGDAAALGAGAGAGLAGSMLVASQCYGTGSAVALVAPIVAFLLRPATLRAPLPRAVILAVPVLVLLAWIAMTGLRTRLNPGGLDSTKAFALLATDVRHIGPVAAHLAGIGLVDLVLGLPFPVAGYGNALSWATISVFGIAVAAAFAFGDAWTRRVLLALLLLVATCYLAVSAGRASLHVARSKDYLLDVLLYGGRYHYLAQAILAVAVALVLFTPGWRQQGRLGIHAVAGVWTAWALVTPLLFAPHVAPLEEKGVARARGHLERAIRAQPVGATVCLPVQPAFLAVDFPGTLGVFVLYYPTDEFEGRLVRFVSSNPKVLALRATSDRLRRLILPDGACPQPGGVPGPD